MPLIIILLMNILCEYSLCNYSLQTLFANILCKYSLQTLFANILCKYSLQTLFANILCKYSLQKTKSALSTGLIAVYRSSSENFSLHFQEFDVEIEFFSRHLMI